MHHLINCPYDDVLAQFPFLKEELSTAENVENISPETYYSYDDIGLEFKVHDETNLIEMVVFYPFSKGFSVLHKVGKIPESINFGSSRAEIEKKLGEPAIFFEKEYDPLLGMQNPMSRYNFEFASLFIQFCGAEEKACEFRWAYPAKNS
ncbi:hypothetical protein ACNKU7_18490 [Microbulbifer sp. SA54]|uniref:hypothetical protein n=1 Tax=Microbulbifer sp. SA54 TaxID=3401577 RepID=UPI003AAB55C5